MRALDSTQRACEGRAAASLLQLAVPTRRFDRKYRARVLVHSLHALSSESFKNACFKLRQGNIESETLDTKKFLKKLPLVVLTATRTRACGYIGPSRVSLKDSTKVEIRRVRECTHPQFVQYLIRSVPAFGWFALSAFFELRPTEQ